MRSEGLRYGLRGSAGRCDFSLLCYWELRTVVAALFMRGHFPRAGSSAAPVLAVLPSHARAFRRQPRDVLRICVACVSSIDGFSWCMQITNIGGKLFAIVPIGEGQSSMMPEGYPDWSGGHPPLRGTPSYPYGHPGYFNGTHAVSLPLRSASSFLYSTQWPWPFTVLCLSRMCFLRRVCTLNHRL